MPSEIGLEKVGLASIINLLNNVSMRIRLLLVLLFFSLFSSVIAHADDKIVIVGDSLSDGYGVARERTYPALLQAKITKVGKKWTVVNQSISGSTTASGPSRVQWALKSHPTLILIALGGNDGLRGLPPTMVDENLTKAVKIGQAAKVKVLLAGIKIPPNYGADYIRKFEAVFPNVAKRTGVPLIPFLLANVGGQRGLNQEDGLHPNPKGHVIIAETIFAALEQQL